MNKYKKIILILILIISIIIIDSIQAFVFDNNPIIKIKTYYDGGNIHYKSSGLLIDTYNCSNGIKDSVIKGFSYSCDKIDGNYILIDKTKNIPDFVCAEALEEFYEDETYTYYWNCIKNEYMIIRYNDLSEELISEALLNDTIEINELDKFNINYLKYEK